MSVAPLTGKLFSFSNNGMRSGNNRTANKKRFNAIRALFARQQEQDFPIHNPFESAEAIREYLNGERIICLRCGKPYKALAGHITRVHEWTADEYKKFYGLPWRTGLTCVDTRAQKVANLKRCIEEGTGVGRPEFVEHREEWRKKAHATRHRARTLVQVEASKANLRLMNNGIEWKEADFYRVLDLMAASDLVAREVLCRDDVPSRTMFYEKTRTDKRFARAYAKTADGLSFEAQARSQRLSDEFDSEVRRRRAVGETVKGIAAALGTSVQSIINHSAGFKAPPRTSCSKGHPAGKGERCKICDTETTRRLRGFIPREVSCRTPVPGNCMACGAPVIKMRIRANRPKLCDQCRLMRQRAANTASYHKKLKMPC